MQKPSVRARARYAFDNVMSRGMPAMVGLLGLASLVLVVIIATLASLLAPADVQENGNWLGVLWRSSCARWTRERWAATRAAGPTCS